MSSLATVFRGEFPLGGVETLAAQMGLLDAVDGLSQPDRPRVVGGAALGANRGDALNQAPSTAAAARCVEIIPVIEERSGCSSERPHMYRQRSASTCVGGVRPNAQGKMASRRIATQPQRIQTPTFKVSSTAIRPAASRLMISAVLVADLRNAPHSSEAFLTR